MRVTTMMLAAIATAAAMAIAGCGGDETTGETTAAQVSEEQGSAPEASETIEEFAQRFQEAAAAAGSGDCEAVDEFNRLAGFLLPCDEKNDEYDDVEIVDTDVFGPAAIVDYTSKGYPDGATAIAAVADDGQFHLTQSLVPATVGLDPVQAGTELSDEEGRDQTVSDFVAAVREKDCETYFDLGLTPTQDKAEECKIEFAPKSQIQPQLEAAPDAEPELLGGTEAFAFYGLDTGENYRVLTVIRNYGPDEEPAEDPYVVATYRSV